MPPSPRIDDGAILDATLTAVQRLGVRKLALVDVAAEAGISRHTIYRRFRTKSELLDALGHHVVARFYDDLLAAARARPDPRKRAGVIADTVVSLSREMYLGTLIELEPVFYRRFVASHFGEWVDVVTRTLVWPAEPPAKGTRRAALETVAAAILRHGISFHVLEPGDWDSERIALTAIAEALLAPATGAARSAA